MSRKPFKKEEKLAAIELWQASVPLAKIRSQLGMSKATLKPIQSSQGCLALESSAR